MTTVEEVKARLPIEQVIGEYVSLRQMGMNWKGLCPFHQEKTPSFMVSADKQIWHCFGCHEGGDLFSFIQKYEGVDFKEALQLLAEKAGVQIQHVSREDTGKKKQAYELYETARQYYSQRLAGDDSDAKKVRDYLASRGTTDESIKKWSLGVAPDSWDALYKELSTKFAREDIVSCGLAVSRDGKVYDRFRKRLMFPIRDAQGRTVAFTARTLHHIVYSDEDIGGKYINSPQSSIYNKSQILYGFDLAKHEIKRLGYAIIVEGNMDAVMSYQAGIENVIAVSGTALTQDQLQLLSRYTENLILAFDADTAGSQAVFRGITLAWNLGMNLKVVVLKEGKDPAEVIAHDPQRWRQAVKDAVGVVDYYFDEVLSRVDLSRADHKKQAVQKIGGIIAKLKTPIEKAHYFKLLATRLNVPENAIWSMVQALPQEPAVGAAVEVKKIDKRTKNNRRDLVSQHLLSFVSEHSPFVPMLLDEIEPELMSVTFQELYKNIILYYTKHNDPMLRNIGTLLEPLQLQQWSELVFQGHELYARLTPIEQEHEFKVLSRRLAHEYHTRRLKELTLAIQKAEEEGNLTAVQDLISEHNKLTEKRQSLGT